MQWKSECNRDEELKKVEHPALPVVESNYRKYCIRDDDIQYQ